MSASSPMTVLLRAAHKRAPVPGFGFAIQGERPCRLVVLAGGVAHRMGLKSGDELLAMDGQPLDNLNHLECAKVVRKGMRRKELLLTTRRATGDQNWPATEQRLFRRSSAITTATNSTRPSRWQSRRSLVPLNTNNGCLRPASVRAATPPSLRQRHRLSMVDGHSPSSLSCACRSTCSEASATSKLSTSSPSCWSSTSAPLWLPQHSTVATAGVEQIAQFVLQFLGRCLPNSGEEQCPDTALLIDKALVALPSTTTEDPDNFCILEIFEERLLIRFIPNHPSNTSLTLQSHVIHAVSRSRVEEDVFGVVNKEAGAFGCFLFRTLPNELLDHREHSGLAEKLGITCRLESANFERDAQCAQFQADCTRIVSTLRFTISSVAPPANPAAMQERNQVVQQFLRTLGKSFSVADADGSLLFVGSDTATSVAGSGHHQMEGECSDSEEEADNSLDTLVEFGSTTNSSSEEEGQPPGKKANSMPESAHSTIPPPPPPRAIKKPSAEAPPRPPPPPRPPVPVKPAHLRRQPLAAAKPVGIRHDAEAEQPKATSVVAEQQQKLHAQKERSTTATTTFSGEEAESAVHLDSKDVAVEVLTNQLPPEKLPSSNSDDFRPVAHNSEEEETIWPTDKWPTTNTAPPNIGNGADATAAALDQRLALAFCTAEESAKENRCPYIEIRPSPSGTHPQRKAEQPPPTGASMPGGGVAGGANSPQHQQQQEHHGRGSGGLDIDLEQVLRSESARAPFHQFLQQQFCAENINFYLAVEEYKKIPENEADRRLDFGRQIYDRHFAANCIEPVNIDNSTSNQIREAYKCNRFTVDVYDVVQYQIFHLLKYDCWPRYLRAGGQLAEEFGGDAKSHDSGASTSRNDQSVDCKRPSAGATRRKSIFRFLRLQRGSDDPAEELVEHQPHACTCAKTPQPQRKPLGTVNSNNHSMGASKGEREERRSNSRSPNRGLLRKARRSYAGSSALLWRDRRQCTCRCRGCGGKVVPAKEFGEPKPDFPVRYCTLLCAETQSSTEIALSDPFQSVRQWTAGIAESCGLDRNACEVVDAQTGSTIDPVRQAVDALNNRVVRIMPVVKFPVVFLGPSASTSSSKPTAPLPAKAVILRCRPALTVGKVLRPIMAKYNVDTEQAVVCLAGTCDVLKLQTPVSNVYQKTLAVMSQQQFAERKLLPKREYQKEMTIAPHWMLTPSGQSSPGGPESPQPPFHQHGDVGFCEIPLEPEGGKLGGGLLLKHSATRSYSSNPREFFKFGRKPTMQPKGRGGTAHHDPTESVNSTVPDAAVASHAGTSAIGTHLRYRKSGGSSMGGGRNSAAKDADRRKSLGAAASAATPVDNAGTPTSATGPESGGGSSSGAGGPRMSSAALAVGLVAPSDIPYCGELEPSEEAAPVQEVCSSYSVPSSMAKHESVTFSKSAVLSSSPSRMECSSSHEDQPMIGANGQPLTSSTSRQQSCPIPALFTSTVRSDKDSSAVGGGTGISPSPSTDSGTMVWQKADYV